MRARLNEVIDPDVAWPPRLEGNTGSRLGPPLCAGFCRPASLASKKAPYIFVGHTPALIPQQRRDAAPRHRFAQDTLIITL